MHEHLIVISPTLPSLTSGYGIAVASSLSVLCNKFDTIDFIVIDDKPFNDSVRVKFPKVAWLQLHVPSESKIIRFCRSLFSTLPAVTMKYLAARKKLEATLKRISLTSSKDIFIVIEDLPLCYCLPFLSKHLPNAKVAIRSHNVLYNSFEKFARIGLVSRWAWKLELYKIYKFERDCLLNSKNFWAITENDSNSYLSIYGKKPQGVFGVSLDAKRYAQSFVSTDSKAIVHVGTADLRKGHSLQTFVNNLWPEIKRQVPEAQLILAGKGTEHFNDVDLGILGLGFVDNDIDVLKLGLIFINPQTIGSGIKLKSIIAMLSGKALLTTNIGIEGVIGLNNKHYICPTDDADLIKKAVFLLKNSDIAKSIGESAKTLATSFYSKDVLQLSVADLLVFFKEGTNSACTNSSKPTKPANSVSTKSPHPPATMPAS